VTDGTLRRKVVLGAVAAAALVGGGSAIAAGQLGSDPDQQAILKDAAEQLGVEPSELNDALVKAVEARIDAAVTSGELTKEQGKALKQRVEAEGVPLFGGPLLHGPGHGVGLHHFGGLDAAAEYLGLTEDELRAGLESGTTLAEVATAQGKTVEGLTKALVDAAEKDIAAAVDEGRLTESQADEIRADLHEHIDRLVNGELPGPPPGFDHRAPADRPGGVEDASATHTV
jgi:polyhydroxyalkanoate synthesis regulator phasin